MYKLLQRVKLVGECFTFEPFRFKVGAMRVIAMSHEHVHDDAFEARISARHEDSHSVIRLNRFDKIV